MDDRKLEYAILYILSGCAAICIAMLARLSTLTLGFDNFSANIVFLVAIAVAIVIFLSIQLTLKNLLFPWIGERLSKIPYFRKKIESRQVPMIAEEVHPDTQEQLSLEEIRNEQQRNRVKEQKDILNIAINYTRKSFALYLSDEHLDVLCLNLRVYINELDTKELKSVKVKELTAIDLRHFGWNIWNYSKPRNQMDIAYFLKIVFPCIFKDAEVDSIKRHLKDDELKGIIKIQESLSEQ
ncbi:MAG: hypothetical protein LBV74_15455 [Tannerella sp.]|jgi:hypothetical protein|nr:hypothetical protein [Tannerella sp.]